MIGRPVVGGTHNVKLVSGDRRETSNGVGDCRLVKLAEI